MLQRVLREIGLPVASVLVLSTNLTGRSLVLGGMLALGTYVMVPRSSRLSSSAFQDFSHSAESGAIRACVSVVGDVNGGEEVFVACKAWGRA